MHKIEFVSVGTLGLWGLALLFYSSLYQTIILCLCNLMNDIKLYNNYVPGVWLSIHSS